ncbi:WD repeat-containing protein 8 [Cristinia sonorae]|uniref:WD repeat-containing protein 8 n=1 Tax=Cristinia sonorae TaxID=1940300 RepID=A0A8K0USP7_9AGAR|nr:WD repeat-containing protein 8 [Cristinia sonorae]
MDFTEIYKQTSGLVFFSPGAHFILTAAQDRLVVRRADSFQITRAWHASSDASQSSKTPSARLSSGSTNSPQDGWITHAGWSCDSEYILAACARRGVVNVYKLRDENWSARIDAGTEGLVKAEWAPDGRSVLCFSAWGLRVSIWSLVGGTSTYIQFPLHPDRGYAFRSDGRYFVLAERHRSKDTAGVYDASESYRLVRHYPLPTTSLASLSLSPTGNHVAVWESSLEYKLYVLSLAGDLLGSFSADPDPGFGIRSVEWHPSGAFLAVAGWDDKIHILESLTWTAVISFELQSRVSGSVSVWREPTDWLEQTRGRGFLSYERVQPPYSLSFARADFTKANPKAGAIQLSFNTNGTLLLARFENAPAMIFLYSFPSSPELRIQAEDDHHTRISTPKLRSVLVHSKPVMSARWNPVRKGSLAVCTGSGSMYLWSDEWVGEGGELEEVAECVGVPALDFCTRDIRWAPDGKGLVLVDKDTFCCGFEVEEEEAVG